MSNDKSLSQPDHSPSMPGDSNFLIVCISLYDGQVMQDEEENMVFLNPHFKSINEKLEIYDGESAFDGLFKPEERADQLVNVLRLLQIQWKDRTYQLKVSIRRSPYCLSTNIGLKLQD